MSASLRRFGFLAPVALCLLAGWAQAISIAAPWDGQPRWWLQLASFAVLVALADGAATPRVAAWRGWAFSLAWLGGTFWWLFISLHTYGGLPAPIAVLAVASLAGLLALYYAMAVWVVRWCAVSQRAWRAVLWAGVWVLAELARTLLFTGFPWGAGGYAHVDGPFAVFAPWVGVYGITTLATFVASLLVSVGVAAMAWRSGWQVAAGLPASIAGLAAVGVLAWQLASQPTLGAAGALPDLLTVSLLQGNIPQDEKFQPGTGIEDSLRWYGEQLSNAKTSLVVAPETALPLLPDQLPAGYWADLQARFATGGQAALIGMPLGNLSEGYTNAAVGLQPGGTQPYLYAKHHLVPFGEFIPPLFRWFTEMMNIPLGDFRRGDVGQASMALGTQRLAPNICYEDLFGEELGARFADPALAPTIFVNLSNIGWFGDSVAIDQHLGISRMRALEFHRPMIRATNTGPTVIIDAQGRVTHALPRLTRGVLVGNVQGRTDITPFAWWVARFGLMPIWLGALVVVLGAVAARWRRQLPRS